MFRQRVCPGWFPLRTALYPMYCPPLPFGIQLTVQLVSILSNFFYQFNGNILQYYTRNAPNAPANVGSAAVSVGCFNDISINKAQKKIKDTIIPA